MAFFSSYYSSKFIWYYNYFYFFTSFFFGLVFDYFFVLGFEDEPWVGPIKTNYNYY